MKRKRILVHSKSLNFNLKKEFVFAKKEKWEKNLKVNRIPNDLKNLNFK